jgi:hypothetical protein
MRGTEMPYERFTVTMARNSETLILKLFAMTWVLNTSIRVRIHLPRMAWWNGKTEWLGRCSMSIGLREGSGLIRSIPRAMLRRGSTLESTRRKPVMS